MESDSILSGEKNGDIRIGREERLRINGNQEPVFLKTSEHALRIAAHSLEVLEGGWGAWGRVREMLLVLKLCCSIQAGGTQGPQVGALWECWGECSWNDSHQKRHSGFLLRAVASSTWWSQMSTRRKLQRILRIRDLRSQPRESSYYRAQRGSVWLRANGLC